MLSPDKPERHLKNLEALLDVSKAMSSHLSLDALLQVIIEHTTREMKADRTTLFLFDEKENTLWTKIAQGLENSKIIRFPIGHGIAGHVAATRQCANIPDAYADPNFNPAFDQQTGYQTRSVLCMPLMTSNKKLVGVIQVLNKKGGQPFDRDDESLLEALSIHAALALERSQLFEVAIEKQRMDQALRLAHEIQMNLLPRGLPSGFNAKAIDLHAALIPAQEVGGDLYDYFLIDETKLFFVIGDVAGKGVPAALFMAVTKTLIKAFARRGLQPHEILASVNEELCLNNDSCTFVTLFCGVLNPNTGELRFANAGHNPPFFVSKDGIGEYLKMPDGMAAGIMSDAKFGARTMKLLPHDSLLLYTDGITEAINAEDTFFSEKRLEQTIRNLHKGSSREIVEGILKRVENFSEGRPQADDITLMNIRITKH